MTGQNQDTTTCLSCGFTPPRIGAFCPKCGAPISQAEAPAYPREHEADDALQTLMNPEEGGLGHDVVLLSQPKSSSRSEVESTAMYGDDVMARVRAAVAVHEQEHPEQAVDVSATLMTFSEDSPPEDDNTVVVLTPTGANAPYTEASDPDDDDEYHTLTQRPSEPAPQSPDVHDTLYQTELPLDDGGRPPSHLPSVSSSTYDVEHDATATEVSFEREERDPASSSASVDNAPAQTMISGEYISSDSLLKGGAGATSMYIPTSAILEAVKAAEARADDIESVSPPLGRNDSTATTASLDAVEGSIPFGVSDPAGMKALLDAAAIEKTTEASDFIELSDHPNGDDSVATQDELPGLADELAVALSGGGEQTQLEDPALGDPDAADEFSELVEQSTLHSAAGDGESEEEAGELTPTAGVDTGFSPYQIAVEASLSAASASDTTVEQDVFLKAAFPEGAFDIAAAAETPSDASPEAVAQGLDDAEGDDLFDSIDKAFDDLREPDESGIGVDVAAVSDDRSVAVAQTPSFEDVAAVLADELTTDVGAAAPEGVVPERSDDIPGLDDGVQTPVELEAAGDVVAVEEGLALVASEDGLQSHDADMPDATAHTVAVMDSVGDQVRDEPVPGDVASEGVALDADVDLDTESGASGDGSKNELLSPFGQEPPQAAGSSSDETDGVDSGPEGGMLPFAAGDEAGVDVTSTTMMAVPKLSDFAMASPDATVASLPAAVSADDSPASDTSDGSHVQETPQEAAEDGLMSGGTDEHGVFPPAEDVAIATGPDTLGGVEVNDATPEPEGPPPGPMDPKERQKLNATLMFGIDVSTLPGLEDVSSSTAPSTAQPSPYADAAPYAIRDTQKVSDDFDEALAGQEGVAVAVKAIFGDEPPVSKAAVEETSPETAARSSSGSHDGVGAAGRSGVADRRANPLNATMAFGVYEPPEAPVSAPKVPAAEKKRKERKQYQQTMAIDNVAEKMAEMAREVEQKQSSPVAQSHDSTLAFGMPTGSGKTSRRVSLGQTMAMDALEIQQWAEDMGVAPEVPVDDDVNDATEQLAMAERAVDEERYPEAIELYLALMKAFPAERHYQERLEYVWSLLREREISSLELPAAVPVGPAVAVTSEQLPWSSKQQKKIHLYWGASLLLLLVAGGVLGFVWPGWLRVGTTGNTTPMSARQPGTGLTSMQINSTPIGASIWLDGQDTGFKTPMTMQKKPGQYALALRLEGYRPLKKTIVLKPGMAFAIEFALAPEAAAGVDPGVDPTVAPTVAARTPARRKRRRRRGRKATHTRLRLRSRPSGAAITINERATGRKTPATLKLPVGRYQIQLQRSGYQTYIRDVTLRYRRQRLRVRLVRTSSQAQTRISVVTRPPGATIAIDGKALEQTTPATFPVSAETLVLTLSKQGYRTSNQKLSLKSGETRRIEVSLRKKGPAGMVYVRSGAFWMGNNAGIAREKPMRKVKMRGFYIDRYEVSVAQYKACVAAGKCRKAGRKSGCNAGKKGKDNHPINCVSWYDAVKYCRWAKKRLPTEAEWEKAARGTSTQLYPWGHSSPSCGTATYGRRCGGFGTSASGVRKGGRSPYGAYDMAGNVWEWVADYFDRSYYSKAASANPYNRFRGSGYRVIRGGAWNTRADQLHVSYRLEYWPTRRTNSIGFRCAR